MGLGGLAVIAVMGLVVFVCVGLVWWLMRTVTAQRAEQELNVADIKRLQDTVETLIHRLKEASDEAVEEMEIRQQKLEALLERADGLLSNDGVKASDGVKKKAANKKIEDKEAGEIIRLAEEGVDGTEIARRTGISRAEVELMLEMHAIRR
jgi:cytoskeletal protein RodZ